jgi:hypothetical protein
MRRRDLAARENGVSYPLISKDRKAYQLLNDRCWRKADIRKNADVSQVL